MRRLTYLTATLLSYAAIAYLFHAAGLDLTRELVGGGDGFTAGLPSKVFGASFSAWNPYVQLGHYSFSNTQFQALYPPGLLIMSVFPNTLGYNLFILSHYALAGFFFYLFAHNLALTRYAAYFGGICFMSCGFLLGHKGHQAMMSTAVWLPLMLLFADRYSRSGVLWNATLGGIALALSILGGFPQVTLYGTALTFAYLGYRCLPRVRRCLGGAALMSVVGILLSSTQLLAVAESLPYSTRETLTRELFNQDSLPVYHLALLFIPNLLGDFYGTPVYSSAYNFVEGYPYAGLLPLLLAVFAVAKLARRNGDVFFWIIAVSICAVLALGLGPVQHILYYVPFYNLFRAPARHLHEVNFGLCILAAYGVNALLTRELPSGKRAAKFTIALAAFGFTIVLAISQLLRYEITQRSPAAIQIQRFLANPLHTMSELEPRIYANLAPGSPTILYAVILFAASVLVFWRLTSAPPAAGLKAAALGLVLLDVWLPYRTLYDNPDTSVLTDAKLQPELNFIMKRGFDRAHYRIYPTDLQTQHEYPLLNMMYGIGTINDYSPMWSKRYQSVTQFALNGESPTIWFEPKLLQTLGARYLITRHPGVAQQLRRVPDGGPHNASDERKLAMDCNVLYCASVTSPGPESVALVSPDGAGVGMIQFPMVYQPSTVYQIAFDARTEPERSAVLNIDLYSIGGKWAFGAAQSQSVGLLGSIFERRVLLIRSGAAPGREGFLRLFTSSKSPIEIHNLTLATMPSFGNAYRELYGSPEGYIVFENPGALPRFRFVSEALPASNLTEARAVMVDPTFDPVSQAVVEGLTAPTVVDSGRILSERIDNDRMEWQVETGTRSFFMVADSWAPGWRARVDGHETPILIVDGFLRGIFVEGAGRHSVDMRFQPRSFRNGLLGTLLGCMVGAGTFLAPTRKGRV